jgi:hypothetical protein
MNYKTTIGRWAAVVLIVEMLLVGGVLRAQEKASPLLVMISIDGLRPDYVTAADDHGAKVPNLRRFMKEGAYAEGVAGVVPTVTYPSHTTLVTGVWPATHGILANTTFDPLQKNYQGWYWYAEDIRVETLWDAAAQAGRTTASIQWPVTVGHSGILAGGDGRGCQVDSRCIHARIAGRGGGGDWGIPRRDRCVCEGR